MEPVSGALERWIHGLFICVCEEEEAYRGVDLGPCSHQRSAGNCLQNTGTGDLSRLPPVLKVGPSAFLFCYWFCSKEVRRFPYLLETDGWSLSGAGLVKQCILNT